MAQRTVKFHDTLKIDVPDSWREDNVTFLSNRSVGEDAVSVVLRREPVDPRTDLAMYSDLQIAELAKSLPSFTLLGRREAVIGGAPAIQLAYTWLAQGTSHSQVQTMFRDSFQTVVCVTTSSSVRKAREVEQEFASILQSIRLDVREGSPDRGR